MEPKAPFRRPDGFGRDWRAQDAAQGFALLGFRLRFRDVQDGAKVVNQGVQFLGFAYPGDEEVPQFRYLRVQRCVAHVRLPGTIDRPRMM
jgi:hypothetical protein